jgi:hypothetical protein
MQSTCIRRLPGCFELWNSAELIHRSQSATESTLRTINRGGCQKDKVQGWYRCSWGKRQGSNWHLHMWNLSQKTGVVYLKEMVATNLCDALRDKNKEKGLVLGNYIVYMFMHLKFSMFFKMKLFQILNSYILFW